MSEREDFADWKNQSNSVNPWLAWQARANLAAERIAELEAREREMQELLQRVVDEAAHLAGWSLNLERDIVAKIDKENIDE